MKKFPCFLLLTAGALFFSTFSICAANAVPTGVPGMDMDANEGQDYYTRAGEEGNGYESVRLIYQASGQNNGIVAVPTGVPGTDMNSGEDYYIRTGEEGNGYESVSIKFQANRQNNSIVAVPTGIPGTDANSGEDYEVHGVAFVPRNKPATAHRFEEECIR